MVIFSSFSKIVIKRINLAVAGYDRMVRKDEERTGKERKTVSDTDYEHEEIICSSDGCLYFRPGSGFDCLC